MDPEPLPLARTWPPTPPVTVTAEAVAAFAAALGVPDDPVPPTFAMVIAGPAWEALFTDPDLGLALERTMHAEQGFSFSRPLRVGDAVTATLRLDQLRRRESADWVGVTVTLDAADGPVGTATSLFVVNRETAA